MSRYSSKLPLVVDLDGTLIKTDLLTETGLNLVKKNFFFVFLFAYWLFTGGKAFLKRMIAERTDLDVTSLPFNESVIKYLKSEQKKRPIILATGSNIFLAQKVAAHVEVFAKVFGSNDKNLTGKVKSSLLVKELGEKKFDYIGNAISDLSVWKYSKNILVVNLTSALKNKFRSINREPALVFSIRKSVIADFVRSIRIHQWLKNFLIFVPFLLSTEGFEFYSFLSIVIGFLSFSIGASALYIINDLYDLENDRHHPKKRKRPFAAGSLSLSFGFFSAVTLVFLSILLSVFLPLKFFLILGSYLILSFIYSSYLKKIVITDAFCLSFLYTMRLLAGTTFLSVTPTFWLYIFSLMVFLSLAFLKRYSELFRTNDKKLKGRGYYSQDLSIISILGVCSGLIAFVLLTLYFASTEIQSRYTNPHLLWISTILFLFWIVSIWFSASRGLVDDDPVVYASTDKQSLLTIFVAILAFFAAL